MGIGVVCVLVAVLLATGCDGHRFRPGETSGVEAATGGTSARVPASTRESSAPGGTTGGVGSGGTLRTARGGRTAVGGRDGSGWRGSFVRGYVPVVAVGESVMLDAVPYLERDIPDLVAVDARVGLQVEPAIGILERLRSRGLTGGVVVVHLGTNGTITPREFDTIMRVLDGARGVVFVDDAAPRPWIPPNNAVISAGVRRYPARAVLVDWHAASAGHPEYFAPDGVHLTPLGARLYASLVAAGVREAIGGSGRKRGGGERSFRRGAGW
ncbi:hypothetical protein [Rubrobacter calidifluminis]|uniref:hypothetical protein n=1 Tax=Rubrobacter calidifluminis TaxID=1392640 RepID=UPI0023613721|nr:hypothetical protein [Rubrobacter calidifluminis]